jgi:hypothetical protein
MRLVLLQNAEKIRAAKSNGGQKDRKGRSPEALV